MEYTLSTIIAIITGVQIAELGKLLLAPLARRPQKFQALQRFQRTQKLQTSQKDQAYQTSQKSEKLQNPRKLKKAKGHKQNLKTLIANLFKPDATPVGCFTALTIATIMAHEATYAGTSVGAGYNLATARAVPFLILLVIDIIAIISEAIGFISDKSTRKPRLISILVGIVLGVIVSALTLKIMLALYLPMPWYLA